MSDYSTEQSRAGKRKKCHPKNPSVQLPFNVIDREVPFCMT